VAFHCKRTVSGGISHKTVSEFNGNNGEKQRLRAMKQQVSVTFWPNLNETKLTVGGHLSAINGLKLDI